jgi:hypothetical protein
MYVSYTTSFLSEVLFLYDNHNFEKGTLIDNNSKQAHDPVYAYTPRSNHFEYTLKGTMWQTGTWQISDNTFSFSADDFRFNLKKTRQENHEVLIGENGTNKFYNIGDAEVIKSVLTFKHFFLTRSIMEKNLENKTAIVNNGHFGKAVVNKNFDITTA